MSSHTFAGFRMRRLPVIILLGSGSSQNVRERCVTCSSSAVVFLGRSWSCPVRNNARDFLVALSRYERKYSEVNRGYWLKALLAVGSFLARQLRVVQRLVNAWGLQRRQDIIEIEDRCLGFEAQAMRGFMGVGWLGGV